MTPSKYITLSLDDLDGIITGAIDHIANELSFGNYTEIINSVKEALIENRIKEDMEICMGRTVYGKQSEFDQNDFEGIADEETIIGAMYEKTDYLNLKNTQTNEPK